MRIPFLQRRRNAGNSTSAAVSDQLSAISYQPQSSKKGGDEPPSLRLFS
jgi:hypothetical protein